MTVKLLRLKEKNSYTVKEDSYLISNATGHIYLTSDEVRQLVELLKEEGF